MISWLTISACLIAIASLSVLPAWAADAPAPPRTVSTSGQAVIHVVPDEAVIYFTVLTFDHDLDKATQANSESCRTLVAALKQMGIDDKSINTDRLNVQLKYSDWQNPGTFVGFSIQRSYMINLKDIKQFEKLVETALKNGANQIGGFEFRTSELRKYREQARSMAIQAAREKAVALARELDCKILKPRTITESPDRDYGRSGNANYQAQSEGPGSESGDIMPPGQIEIRASIDVTFDME
jgi:uncharacterized protein YggE